MSAASTPVGNIPVAAVESQVESGAVLPGYQDIVNDPTLPRAYLVILYPVRVYDAVQVPVYLSSHGFISSSTDSPANTIFEPRISNPINYSAQAFRSGEMAGESSRTLGDIEIVNADGGLDFFEELAFDGTPVEVYLGPTTCNASVDLGSGAPYMTSAYVGSYTGESTAAETCSFDNFVLINRATVDHVLWDETRINVKVKDRRVLLDAPVLDDEHASGTDIDGQKKPAVFGTVLNITPQLIDASTLTYQVSDRAGMDIQAVYFAGVAVTEGVSYTKSIPNGTITLLAAPGGIVTCDVYRRNTLYGGGTTVPALVSTLLQERSGFTWPDDFDVASFNAAEVSNPAPAGLFVDSEISVAEAIDQLVKSIGAFWTFDRLDRVRIQIIGITGPINTISTKNIQNIRRVQAPVAVSKVTLGYRRNFTPFSQSDAAPAAHSTGGWLFQESKRLVVSDTDVEAIHTENNLIVESLLLDQSAAQDEANRLLALLSYERGVYELRLANFNHGFQLGDGVLINHARYNMENFYALVVGVRESIRSGEVILDVWGGTRRAQGSSPPTVVVPGEVYFDVTTTSMEEGDTLSLYIKRRDYSPDANSTGSFKVSVSAFTGTLDYEIDSVTYTPGDTISFASGEVQKLLSITATDVAVTQTLFCMLEAVSGVTVGDDSTLEVNVVDVDPSQPNEVIMDNGDSGTTPYPDAAAWPTADGPAYDPADPAATALWGGHVNNATKYEWVIPVTVAGTYDIFAWWTKGSSNYRTIATYEIDDDNGTHSVSGPETDHSDATLEGQWNRIGTAVVELNSFVTIRLLVPASGNVCADAIKIQSILPAGDLTDIQWSNYNAGTVYVANHLDNDFRHTLNDRSSEFGDGYTKTTITMNPGNNGVATALIQSDSDMTGNKALELTYQPGNSGSWFQAWDNFSRDNFYLKPVGGTSAAVDFPKSAYADTNFTPGRPPGEAGEAGVQRDSDSKVYRFDELYMRVECKFMSGADGTWQSIPYLKLWGFGDGTAQQTSHQANVCYNAEGYYSGAGDCILLRTGHEWGTGWNNDTDRTPVADAKDGYPGYMNPMACYHYNTTTPAVTNWFCLDDPTVTDRNTIADSSVLRFYIPPTDQKILIECRLKCNDAPSTYTDQMDSASSRTCPKNSSVVYSNGYRKDYHKNSSDVEIVPDNGIIEYWVTDPRPFISVGSDDGSGQCGTGGVRMKVCSFPVRIRLWDRAKIGFSRMSVWNNSNATTNKYRPNQTQAIRIGRIQVEETPFP